MNLSKNIEVEKVCDLRFINYCCENVTKQKNKATVVAPCARQEQVFGIYGPERGGGVRVGGGELQRKTVSIRKLILIFEKKGITRSWADRG